MYRFPCIGCATFYDQRPTFRASQTQPSCKMIQDKIQIPSMVLESKKFKVINEGFKCEHCGEDVQLTSGSTPRNHCPYCLWCRHVDINPGDRANPCKGAMRPIGMYTHTKKEYVILHQCQKCGERVKAKAILDDGNASDDFDLILELSSKKIEEERPNLPHLFKKKRNPKG